MAQTILEYVILLGVMTLALSAMQYYFRRSIQSMVKIAADQVGTQKKGGAEFDYTLDWKRKGYTNITSSTYGTKNEIRTAGGAVTHFTNETSRQTGTISYSVVGQE